MQTVTHPVGQPTSDQAIHKEGGGGGHSWIAELVKSGQTCSPIIFEIKYFIYLFIYFSIHSFIYSLTYLFVYYLFIWSFCSLNPADHGICEMFACVTV